MGVTGVGQAHDRDPDHCRVGVAGERCCLLAADSARVALATDELVAHVRHVERRAGIARTIGRTDGGEQVSVGRAADCLPVTLEVACGDSRTGIGSHRADGHAGCVGEELIDVGFADRVTRCCGWVGSTASAGRSSVRCRRGEASRSVPQRCRPSSGSPSCSRSGCSGRPGSLRAGCRVLGYCAASSYSCPICPVMVPVMAPLGFAARTASMKF